MTLFGARGARLADMDQRILDVDARLGHLDVLLDRVQEGIKALESRPLPAAEPDTRVDRVSEQFERADRMVREHADGLQDLDRRMVELTLATSEGIERVERAERRIRATVARARKELAAEGFESPALEAEAAELRLVDGNGSEELGVQPLREDVEPSGPPPGFGIPGEWTG